MPLQNRFLQQLGRSAVGAAMAAICAASPSLVWAQQAATAAAAPSDDLQEIVVTGSRIKGLTNADSASPISIVTADELALTKATNLEDALSRMTGVTQFTTMASNNGGGGVSTVALRDLGAQRTLILIDGQRLIPIFFGSSSATDLNTIPIAMVERIEILRDGASSIYGADAIGGVVNIITKKHADGATIDLGYGESTHSDGKTTNMAASLANNSDRGNVMVAVSWDKQDAIAQSARPWAVATHGNDPNFPGGSTYRSQLNTLQDENPPGNVWIGGKSYSVTDPAVASLLPYTAYLPGSGKTKHNAGAWNDLTQGIDRKEMSFSAHYDLIPNVTLVTDGFFADKTTTGALRPEPLLGDTIATTSYAGFVVPTYAPGNTTGAPITAFLTPDQFGPRAIDDHSETSRIRVGFEGKIADRWNYELGFVDQHNSTTNVTHNEGNFYSLAQLSGAISCIDVPGGCVAPTPTQIAYYTTNHLPVPAAVPVNMPNFFNGPNMFTADQVKYLLWNNTDKNDATERYEYANIGGEIFNLPAGPLRGTVGLEHRNEFEQDIPDKLVQEGWGPNQSQPTGGGYNVKSYYGELFVPVLKDLPFANSVNLTPSAREDEYDTFGKAFTWKMGLDWSLSQDARVRASYSTGFRAPQVAELFGGQIISDLTANGDPCDTRAPGFNGNSNVGKGVLTAGSTCSLAVANGAAVTNFQSGNNNQTAQQQQVAIGGNSLLKPEKSKSFGYGLVLTPRFAPGLAATIDYYNIRIDNTILTGGIVSATSVDAVLLGCYGPAQNKSYCDLVTRNAAGTITQLNSLNANFGVARVTGTDFSLAYDTKRAGLELPFPGSIAVDLQLEEQYKNSQTNADGSTSNFVGAFQYASEGINPHWKGFVMLDYNVGPWTLHWDTRYIEHMVNFDDPGNHVYGNFIPTTYYHALSGSYRLKDVGPLKSTRFVVGVNNLLDKDPPFLGSDSICKCNSLAGPYDFVGRYVYARMSAQF